MSLDRSLKITGGLAKHRNVLTRAERVERLVKQGRWDGDKMSPIHMPKVGNRKIVAAKKGKKKDGEEDEKGKKKKK